MVPDASVDFMFMVVVSYGTLSTGAMSVVVVSDGTGSAGALSVVVVSDGTRSAGALSVVVISDCTHAAGAMSVPSFVEVQKLSSHCLKFLPFQHMPPLRVLEMPQHLAINSEGLRTLLSGCLVSDRFLLLPYHTIEFHLWKKECVICP